MTHWTRQYLGAPYTPEANCWGLVRRIYMEQSGAALPDIDIGASTNLRALKRAVAESGLRPALGPPRHGDLVVLRSAARTHVGVAAWVNAGLHLVHSTRATGTVVQPWFDASRGCTVELWRRDAGLPGCEPDWADVPMDRDTVRSALQIAAIVASAYFFPGKTGFQLAARAAFAIGATIAINALIPPQSDTISPVGSTGPTGDALSTSLQGNEAALDKPVWKICGRREFTPPYASQPYYRYLPREGEADPQLDRDQFFYALYAVGEGPHTIHGARIGGAPVTRFDGVVTARYLPPGVRPSIVNANVTTSVAVSGLVMETDVLTPAFAACRPDRRVTSIEVDVAAPRGLGKQGDPLSVSFRIQWRIVNDFDQALSPWADLGAFEERTATTSTPQRWTITRVFTGAVRPEIRLLRNDVQDEAPGALHDLVWAGLRGFGAEAADLDERVAHYELVIKASNQLSPDSSRVFSLVAEGWARGLDDALEFTDAAPTRNGALWVLDLATSTTWGMGKEPSRVDLRAFRELSLLLDERQDRFDYVFDSTLNAWDAMQLIAKTFRARVFRRNGVISIARDGAIDAPLTFFSARNSKPAVALVEALSDRQTPDGVIIEYQSATSAEWLSIECPLPGVSSVLNPVYLRLPGVVGAKHAEREGRNAAAVLAWRRRTVTLTTDLQGILPTYMSPVDVVPDIDGYGYTGDVIDYELRGDGTARLVLSEPIDYAAGPLYIRVMRPNGSLTDATPLRPSDDQFAGVIDVPLDFFAETQDANREPPKFYAGEALLCKVQAIEDGGLDGENQLYNLTLIVDDARIHQQDINLLPGPGEVQDPVGQTGESGAPVIVNATLAASALFFTFDDLSIPDPTDQSITFTFVPINFEGVATWSARLLNAFGDVFADVTLGGAGNVRTLSVAQFGAAYRALITATLGNFTRFVYVNRIEAINSDSRQSLSGFLDPQSQFVVQTDALGNGGDYSAVTGQFRVFLGVVDVTSGASFAVGSGITPGIFGAAVSPTGVFSVGSSAVNTGSVPLVASYPGASDVTRPFVVNKSLAQGGGGDPGDPGGPGSQPLVLFINDLNVQDFYPSTIDLGATYTLRNNGTAFLAYPGESDIELVGEWSQAQPLEVSTAARAEVRFTLISGSLDAGSPGVWQGLGTTRVLQASPRTVSSETVVRVEIRDVETIVIQTSATIRFFGQGG